jgi:hypothetical protein
MVGEMTIQNASKNLESRAFRYFESKTRLLMLFDDTASDTAHHKIMCRGLDGELRLKLRAVQYGQWMPMLSHNPSC